MSGERTTCLASIYLHWRTLFCEEEPGHDGFHTATGNDDVVLIWRGDRAFVSEGSLTEVLFGGSSSLSWPELCRPGSSGQGSFSYGGSHPHERHDWVPLESVPGQRSPLASYKGKPMWWYCKHCRRIDEITVGDYRSYFA